MKKSYEDLVPSSLRMAIFIQASLFTVFSAILFIFPETILEFFGWARADGIITRLFAAALFSIAANIIYYVREEPERVQHAVNQIFLFSTIGLVGMCMSIFLGAQDRPAMSWLLCLVFLLNHLYWLYNRFMVAEILAMEHEKLSDIYDSLKNT